LYDFISKKLIIFTISCNYIFVKVKISSLILPDINCIGCYRYFCELSENKYC